MARLVGFDDGESNDWTDQYFAASRQGPDSTGFRAGDRSRCICGSACGTHRAYRPAGADQSNPIDKGRLTMKLRVAQNWISEQRTAPEGGSVLIIVLWVSLGLVTLALYFANSMSFEIRAAENRVASMQAEEAIAGAARYI